MRFSKELRTWKHIKEYGFLSSFRSLSDKYGIRIIDTATKTGSDPPKTASENKTAEETTELRGENIKVRLYLMQKRVMLKRLSNNLQLLQEWSTTKY